VDFVAVEEEFVAVILNGARLPTVASGPKDVGVGCGCAIGDHRKDVGAVEIVLRWITSGSGQDGGEDVHSHTEFVNGFAAFKAVGPAHKGGYADAAIPDGAFVTA